MFDRVLETSEEEFSIDGTKFRFVHGGYDQLTSENEIVVFKPLHYFKRYLQLAQQRGFAPQSMFELGIAEGGSAILFALLLPEAKIVAVDIRQPNPHVLNQVTRLGLSNRVKLFYETSQDDALGIRAIFAQEFTGKVDVILDDASHSFELSRRSFEILLPYVADNRFYILEDWAWAHWQGSGQSENLNLAALSNLVFEMCMLTASRSDLIHETIVDSGKVVLHVNSTASLNEAFQLSGSYLNRGRTLTLV